MCIRDSFYTHFTYLFAEQGGPIHLEEVPYADGVLPCWRIVPADTSKGTILFHGGNDSLLEEFTDALLYLACLLYTSSDPHRRSLPLSAPEPVRPSAAPAR